MYIICLIISLFHIGCIQNNFLFNFRFLGLHEIAEEVRRSFDTGSYDHTWIQRLERDESDLSPMEAFSKTLDSEVRPQSLSHLDSSALGEADKITIITFNAGLLEYRLCGATWYSNPPFARQRLAHLPIAIRGTEADIVGLQEIFDENRAQYLIEKLRDIYPYVARASSGSRMALHNGLMLLSRWEIKNFRFIPFHSVTTIEKYFASKGILETTVDIPGIGSVSFLNMHLASGAVDPESESMETLRNEEIEQLLNVAEDSFSNHRIPVVLGDLNAAPDTCSTNYQAFTERGWEDTFLSGLQKRRERQKQQFLQNKEFPTIHEGLEGDNASSRFHTKLKMQKSLVLSENEGFLSRRHSDTDKHSRPPSSDVDVSRHSSGIEMTNREIADTSEKDSLVSRSAKDTEDAIEDFSPLPTFDKPPKWMTSTKNLVASASNISAAIKRRIDADHDVNTEEENNRRDLACDYHTWDPKNPLNVIGPHAGCHGLRCDYILTPPPQKAGLLANLEVHSSHVIFKEPRVVVEGCCCGLIGSPMLVTLSDHYGVKIELIRKLRQDVCSI
eukprot:GHVP01034596.1.p1 GENE.GHVP01034596.1~~GHVP01034596.1.p1  ORF type:complete len:558 (-),score=94.50 GHVP01034596.1:513-2186(-)